MSWPRGRLAIVVGLSALLVGWPEAVRVAEAQETPETSVCVSAYEKAQKDRMAGHLRQSQESLRKCTNPECPAIVRHDCSEWLREIETAQPTIIVSARTARGQDLSEVRVFVDSEMVADRLSGRPITLDPGEHQIRFERLGSPPLSQRIIANAGEQNRLVQVVFNDREAAPTHPPTDGRTLLVPTVVLGGVGLVATGFGIYLDAVASSEFSDLESRCSPHCAGSEVDPTRTKMIVGDVMLVTGIVMMGVAVVVYFAGRHPSPPTGGSAATKSASLLHGTF